MKFYSFCAHSSASKQQTRKGILINYYTNFLLGNDSILKNWILLGVLFGFGIARSKEYIAHRIAKLGKRNDIFCILQPIV